MLQRRDHSAEDDAFCKRARQHAQSLFDKRKSLLDKSQQLWQSGDKHGAKVASDEAKSLASQAEEAQWEAARQIFAMKNTPDRVSSQEVDLHGLHVDEAVRFAEERLAADKAAGKPLLVIIYGAGTHSVGNKQLLKPKILEMLRTRGFDFTEDYDEEEKKANAGCCSVHLAKGGVVSAAPAFPQANVVQQQQQQPYVQQQQPYMQQQPQQYQQPYMQQQPQQQYGMQQQQQPYMQQQQPYMQQQQPYMQQQQPYMQQPQQQQQVSPDQYPGQRPQRGQAGQPGQPPAAKTPACQCIIL